MFVLYTIKSLIGKKACVGETSKQQLFEKVDIEISELQTELTILELDGYIKEELGVIIKL